MPVQPEYGSDEDVSRKLDKVFSTQLGTPEHVHATSELVHASAARVKRHEFDPREAIAEARRRGIPVLDL